MDRWQRSAQSTQAYDIFCRLAQEDPWFQEFHELFARIEAVGPELDPERLVAFCEKPLGTVVPLHDLPAVTQLAMATLARLLKAHAKQCVDAPRPDTLH